MNKKSIISLFTGAALMFSMPSCTDLDETVYDKIAAENFGKTEGEIVKVVTGMMVVSIVSYTCTHGLRIPQP